MTETMPMPTALGQKQASAQKAFHPRSVSARMRFRAMIPRAMLESMVQPTVRRKRH